MIVAAIATLGGIGHLRPAPGTWASLAAVVLAWLLHWTGGFALLAAASIAALALGIWVCARYVATHGGEDPSEVVIDELVGQWLALWPLSFGLSASNADPGLFPWPGWLLGFALFRLFDIWKPWPVSWADRRHDSWGIMLDDVIAGALAAVGVAIAGALAHGI